MHLDEECQESQAKIDTYWLCCGVAAILRIHRKLSSDWLLAVCVFVSVRYGSVPGR